MVPRPSRSDLALHAQEVADAPTIQPLSLACLLQRFLSPSRRQGSRGLPKAELKAQVLLCSYWGRICFQACSGCWQGQLRAARGLRSPSAHRLSARDCSALPGLCSLTPPSQPVRTSLTLNLCPTANPLGSLFLYRPEKFSRAPAIRSGPLGAFTDQSLSYSCKVTGGPAHPHHRPSPGLWGPSKIWSRLPLGTHPPSPSPCFQDAARFSSSSRGYPCLDFAMFIQHH